MKAPATNVAKSVPWAWLCLFTLGKYETPACRELGARLVGKALSAARSNDLFNISRWKRYTKRQTEAQFDVVRKSVFKLSRKTFWSRFFGLAVIVQVVQCSVTARLVRQPPTARTTGRDLHTSRNHGCSTCFYPPTAICSLDSRF